MTLVAAAKGFPRHLIGMGLGLLNAILTNVETTLVFILGVLIGFFYGVEEGIIVFLAVYLTFRMVGQYINLLARSWTNDLR